jgi:hypothetical protein
VIKNLSLSKWLAQIMLITYLVVNFMIRIFSMTNENIDFYAKFLTQCRQVIGPFDLERLSTDQHYKAEIFNKVAINADDQLFQMAALVNSQLNEEMMCA